MPETGPTIAAPPTAAGPARTPLRAPLIEQPHSRTLLSSWASPAPSPNADTRTHPLPPEGVVHDLGRPATPADLLGLRGKFELVEHRIREFGMPGIFSWRVASRIGRALDDHARKVGRGMGGPDGLDYALPRPLASGRQSFRPDASYSTLPPPANRMRWMQGAPDFAVEVRSESDALPGGEDAMAAKRSDYFAAGTQVVWDVDVEAGRIVKWRADRPGEPTVFQRGQLADAEPALPGWTLAVDEVFAGE